MHRPRISVVTPVLNGERFIRSTVESVLSQKGEFDLEYIVKDGCSSDSSLDILYEYNKYCTIITAKDSSPQDAINQGMAAAAGDICCWLNADDLYEPGALQAAVDAFARHPERKWAYGRCRIINESGAEIRRPVTGYKNLLGYCYSRNVLLCENFINQPATFWKRELWDRAGGLSLDFQAAFDYDLWVKMANLSAAVPIHRFLARFRRHQESISENIFELQFAEEMRVVRQHGNILHKTIHEINRRKITFLYRVMARSNKETRLP